AGRTLARGGSGGLRRAVRGPLRGRRSVLSQQGAEPRGRSGPAQLPALLRGHRSAARSGGVSQLLVCDRPQRAARAPARARAGAGRARVAAGDRCRSVPEHAGRRPRASAAADRRASPHSARAPDRAGAALLGAAAGGRHRTDPRRAARDHQDPAASGQAAARAGDRGAGPAPRAGDGEPGGARSLGAGDRRAARRGPRGIVMTTPPRISTIDRELAWARLAGAMWGPGDRPVMLDGHRLIEVLGRGAMGAVYLAHDPKLDREVAIKLVAHEDRAATLREARALARVAHPNVVAVHQVGELDGDVYIVMELLRGPD